MKVKGPAINASLEVRCTPISGIPRVHNEHLPSKPSKIQMKGLSEMASLQCNNYRGKASETCICNHPVPTSKTTKKKKKRRGREKGEKQQFLTGRWASLNHTDESEPCQELTRSNFPELYGCFKYYHLSSHRMTSIRHEY